MTAPVLRVENLGKAYRRYTSEWQRFRGWFGVQTAPIEERWALRGVTFEAGRACAMGIVGANGAGKSTLLKLIVGTLRATEGRVTVQGRIAAILELGMGFNPELTGRQNAIHAAGLMGFPHHAIRAAIPEIESFAEVGGYFDAPLRTYSSGMQMRVAFAVATAFRPDMLIVDEALSVGDTYFQHKCIDRIRAYREQGTGLLIVSHDSSAIHALCDRAILLEGGVAVRDSDPASVMDYYNARIAEKENSTVEVRRTGHGTDQTVSGSGEARVETIALFNADGVPVERVNVGEPVDLRVGVRIHSNIPRLVFGYIIKDRVGQPVYGTNTWHTGQILKNVRAGGAIEFSVRFAANLGPGSYSISTALVSSDTHLENNYEWRDLALVFTVCNSDKPHFVGSAWIPPVVAITG